MVTEADSDNEMRLTGLSTPVGGVSPTFPRPVRKRGFHRALKRKEPWALAKHLDLPTFIPRFFIKQFYETLLSESPFTNLTKETTNEGERNV